MDETTQQIFLNIYFDLFLENLQMYFVVSLLSYVDSPCYCLSYVYFISYSFGHAFLLQNNELHLHLLNVLYFYLVKMTGF